MQGFFSLLSTIKWRPDIAKEQDPRLSSFDLTSQPRTKVNQDAIFCPRHTSCCLIHHWRYCGPLQTVGTHYQYICIILYSDDLFALQRLGMTVTTPSHPLPSLSPTPQCLPSPPVQVLPMPSPPTVMDREVQSSSATQSMAYQTMGRCQLSLQAQHPPLHHPSPQPVLGYSPMVKDPGDQFTSATLPIPVPLLRDPAPPPTLLLSVFQLVQAPLRPCLLTVKDLGVHSSSSAALLQTTRQGRRSLPILPPLQRLPLTPPMRNAGVYFLTGWSFA